jgi:hypothetical protein
MRDLSTQILNIYIYTYIYILGEGWHNGEVAYLPAVKHGKAITNL